MHQSQNKRAVIVGLFVFIGVSLLITGILIIGNVRETFTRKIKVTALFDDVSGLQVGNNVWFSGVKIGTVSGLHFYEGFQVEVIVSINTKAQEYIRKNAKIKISTDGLIGNKILVIYGGSSKSAEIQEGDTLAVEKTFSQEDMVNALQENNLNLLSVTSDLKTISKKLVDGDGTIGKLINDNALYENIKATSTSLKNASIYTEQLTHSLSQFSSGLNKKGTLANDLVTDTVVFHSIKASLVRLNEVTDTAAVFISNIKLATSNPNASIGALLYDQKTGTHLKQLIENMDRSSLKLEEDLEAAQHSFLLRRYFKKKQKDSLRVE
ncbi:MAG: MlaD family protein [Cytophagales bacterium]|nr:MlaD family protein [Cytophagales bacterium]